MSIQGTENIISIKNLIKDFYIGDIVVHALRRIDIDIKKGEFVAIMGTSGSGKTTLLNIIGCLDKPTNGDYFLDNINVKNFSKNQLAELRNKKLGFVFQTYNLLPRTTALENVELPLLYSNTISHKKRKEKAIKALETVGLVDRMYHMPNQLSGGQQQRVAIARALVNNPVIVLADEPTGNLDTRTSFDIMDVFQKLNDKGITIALVTHESDIAEFATKNIKIKDGKIYKEYEVKNRKNANEILAKLPLD